MNDKTGSGSLSITGRLWLLAVSLILFALVTWQVLSGGALVRFDMWVQQWMQSERGLELVIPARVLTLLGNYYVVIALTLLGALFLAVRRAWRNMAGLLMSVAGAGLSVLVIKAIVDRPRPLAQMLDGIVSMSSSFPSGNSTLAAALFGAIVLSVFPVLRQKQWLYPTTILALIAPLLVAASRVILLMHYVSDTLAGLAMGTAWALLGSLLIPRN